MVKHGKVTLRRKALMKYARTRIGNPIVREQVKVVHNDLAIHVDLTSIDSEDIVECNNETVSTEIQCLSCNILV
jgi:hypothetical protein